MKSLGLEDIPVTYCLLLGWACGVVNEMYIIYMQRLSHELGIERYTVLETLCCSRDCAI